VSVFAVVALLVVLGFWGVVALIWYTVRDD